MAFSISPVLTGQIFNNQGKPLAGGKIFSYAGGSFSTLRDTFTTDTGAIANANPVVLDASGRVPPMFLDTDFTYNFVVTSADESTIIQRFENISPAITSEQVPSNFNFLPLTGGTVSGALTVTGGTTLNVASATSLTVSGATALQAVTASTVTAALNSNSNRIINVLTPTGATDAANKSYVDALVPAGIIAYTAASAAPSGWLIANGSSVSRTTYANLFAAIGTTYGSVDTNTFNLPDLRGYFVRGLDLGRGVDADRTLGSNQTDSLKSHKHGGVPQAVGDNDRGAGSSNFSIDTVGETEETGESETRPVNIALTPIIKF